MKKIGAFGYIRVSGQGQVDGDGFTRQTKAVREYAAANNIRLVKIFKEEGVSGTIENADRPAWRDMMTALFRNGVKAIIVESLDRLTRDLIIQETTIASLQRDGFTLISTKQQDLMNTDPDRIAMRQMQGVFVQLEKSKLVIKLRVARDRKSANGKRCEGRKPFGTRPGEEKVLARIKALRSEGLGFDAIAERLNREGKPTRKEGKKWFGSTINGILARNPINTVEQDVIAAMKGLGTTRSVAEAAVARVRRDGDTFDSLFRRASVSR